MKKIFRTFLIAFSLILGLFFLWFRFILTEYDEFKNTTFFEHRKNISTDGPYILYKNDSVRYISVERKEKTHEVVDRFIPFEKSGISIVTHSYGYDCPTHISFKVNLADSLPIPKSIYPEPDSLFVISDIEGNFYAFHKLLRANKIIDNNSNWNYGNGHLVLLGDFVDRGLNVTQCLWLIYNLEQQANLKGGSVHFILGNHELMNLKGNTIHVRSKYKDLAKRTHLDYSKDLYGKKSELGKWLRTKNCIEKIGDLLFVHAGLSEEFLTLNLSIEETNQMVRNQIDSSYTDPVSKVINGQNGPFWTRKMGHNQDMGTKKTIEKVKSAFNVTTIIIGHSTVSDIYQQFENSLINTDVHFPHNDNDSNRGKALLIESGNRYKVDDLGNKTKV